MRPNAFARLVLFILFSTSLASASPPVLSVGVGSSAVFTTMALASWQVLAGPGAQHFTSLGTCGSSFCATMVDSRSAEIPQKPGRLWVVWSADHSKIWAYLDVESVAGARAFFATPRARLYLASSLAGSSGSNLIPSGFWGADSTLPSDVYRSLNSAALSAAYSDLRPEDAEVAQMRACSPLDSSNYNGLGYCATASTLVGTPIESSYSTAKSNVVAFSLHGPDPFTGEVIKPYTSIDIGASPLIFFYSATGSLARLTEHDLSLATAQELLGTGDDCDASLLGGTSGGFTLIQDDPMSGAWSVLENTLIRLTANDFTRSQEIGVNPTSDNPLDLPCGAGSRRRAIGTGDMIASVKNNLASIGYFLPDASLVCPIANNSDFRYLTVNGVDPFSNEYTNGIIGGGYDDCGVVVPVHGPHQPPQMKNVANGTYPAWTILRAITDASGLANTRSLVAAMQTIVGETTGDFLPVATEGAADPVQPAAGFQLYRSHYSSPIYSSFPNNGLGGEVESGSDVGGCIQHVTGPPGVLGCHQ